jgi:dTDP-4-dehydrorhamnose 3,5-epimerase
MLTTETQAPLHALTAVDILRSPTALIASAALPTNRRRIAGVQAIPLRLVPDERQFLMDLLRADDTLFTKIGQVSVSATHPDVVNAWHYREVQVDYFACVAGMVRLVLVDTRPDSPTAGAVNEFLAGEDNPLLIQVPAMVYQGWRCISPELSLVVNVPGEPYRSALRDEYRLEPLDALRYDWNRSD